jgi:hypothetical protein
MQRLISLCTVTLILLMFGVAGGRAASGKVTGQLPLAEIHEREIIVEFAASRAGKSVSSFTQSRQLSHARSLPLSYKRYGSCSPANQNYFSVLEAATRPEVASASPNVIKHVTETVLNDRCCLTARTTRPRPCRTVCQNNQWALIHRGCLDAWDTTTGDRTSWSPCWIPDQLRS